MLAEMSSRMRSTHSQMPKKLVIIAIGVCLLWCACVWRSQTLLEGALSNSSLIDEIIGQSTSKQPPIDTSIKRRGEPKTVARNRNPQVVKTVVEKENSSPKNDGAPRVIQNEGDDRFIVFRPIRQGQGAGNIVHGLLAVHALAEEFDRIVCTPAYKDFNAAFVPIDAHAVKACKKLVKDEKSLAMEIRLVNYEKAPDECELQRRLASDEEIIYIVGNTYPRWRPIKEKYFTRFYKPKPELQELLPNPMPKTVVHLRQGDRGLDKRDGLDKASLAALGRSLPSDTFLVTNNLSWYDYFATNFTWRHPEWHAVYHSASHSFMWDQRGNLTKKEESREVQNLQMWSDWFVMANADIVWHTHSDFSLSAIHWMNVESKTLKGVDSTGNLKLIDEAFRTDEEMKPLKDRGPDDIKNCQETELDKAVKAKAGAVI